MHWCLDGGFTEDRYVSKIRKTGENMSILRRIAFNLIKAALNETYFEELLGLN